MLTSHPEVDLPSSVFSWEGLQYFNFTDKKGKRVLSYAVGGAMTLIFKATKKTSPHRDTGLTVPEVKHNN